MDGLNERMRLDAGVSGRLAAPDHALQPGIRPTASRRETMPLPEQAEVVCLLAAWDFSAENQ